MTRRPRSLRLVEMTLWLTGVVLLGAALVATLSRWNYPAQQARALLERGNAVSATAGRPSPTEASALIPVSPEQPTATERVGEPAPRVEKKHQVARVDLSAFRKIEISRLGVAAI